MATTVKDSALVKQKSSSSSSSSYNIDSRHGKKIHKSSLDGAGGLNSPLLQKPIPNYLRPTVSSCHDNCKYGNKQGIKDSTTKRFIRRRSFNKPPSTSLFLRTPSSKGRTLTPSFYSPRISTSPKSILERKSITARNGKVQQPLKKSKSFKKVSSSNAKSRATTITTTTTSPDITEKLIIKSEKEEKDSRKVTKEGKEHTIVEVHPLQDQETMNDSTLSEATKISKNKESEAFLINNKESEACYSLSTIEEHEVPKDDEHSGNNEEDDDINDVTSERYEGSLSSTPNEEEVHQEKLKIRKEKADSTEPNKDKKPRKLKFQRGKEAGEDEDGEGGERRLNFKERGEVEVVGDENAESENVVLKNQGGVQGKKEALAVNDVIEETASKLVEKRKSKVKALVGAFETVISLQEPESLSQNPSPSEESKSTIDQA